MRDHNLELIIRGDEFITLDRKSQSVVWITTDPMVAAMMLFEPKEYTELCGLAQLMAGYRQQENARQMPTQEPNHTVLESIARQGVKLTQEALNLKITLEAKEAMKR